MSPRAEASVPKRHIFYTSRLRVSRGARGGGDEATRTSTGVSSAGGASSSDIVDRVVSRSRRPRTGSGKWRVRGEPFLLLLVPPAG